MLNAVGPFQCCITIEFRLPSDGVVTVLLQLLKLLWFDFFAISSLLFFFNDFPMAHKRFRNKNDTTKPAAINMPQIIIEIGSIVLSDGLKNVVVLVVVALRFSFEPLDVGVAACGSFLLSLSTLLSLEFVVSLLFLSLEPPLSLPLPVDGSGYVCICFFDVLLMGVNGGGGGGTLIGIFGGLAITPGSRWNGGSICDKFVLCGLNVPVRLFAASPRFRIFTSTSVLPVSAPSDTVTYRERRSPPRPSKLSFK